MVNDIKQAVLEFGLVIVIESGEERFKSTLSCPRFTKEEVEYLTCNRLAIIEEIKRQEAEPTPSPSYTGGGNIESRSAGGEWEKTPVRNFEKDPVKPWHGDPQNLEEVKEMLKHWDTPEMKAKAREAAAYHDEVHGDDSSDYDDD